MLKDNGNCLPEKLPFDYNSFAVKHISSQHWEMLFDNKRTVLNILIVLQNTRGLDTCLINY